MGAVTASRTQAPDAPAPTCAPPVALGIVVAVLASIPMWLGVAWVVARVL